MSSPNLSCVDKKLETCSSLLEQVRGSPVAGVCGEQRLQPGAALRVVRQVRDSRCSVRLQQRRSQLRDDLGERRRGRTARPGPQASRQPTSMLLVPSSLYQRSRS